jgi:CBS domain-containing protein
MKISEILRRKGADVATISPHATIESALGILKEQNVGALVISSATNPVNGILSERDIVRSLATRGARVLAEHVSDNMTTSVISCAPDELITKAMTTMTTRRFRHMPVIDEGALAGIVSIGDLVKHRLEELEDEASNLRTYIANA